MPNATSKPDDLFNYFVGQWYISRILDNCGTACGIGCFENYIDDNNIYYREDLEIQYTHYCNLVIAYREYWYIRNNNCIAKYYADGTKLYELESYMGRHVCGHDIYETEYRFFNQQKFTTITSVTGPNKKYKIVSVFDRIYM